MRTYLLLINLSFSCILIGCGRNKSIKEPENVTVPVISVLNQKTSLERDYVADIRAIKNVVIFARVRGYLEHIYVDEGQEVKKGQLLFSINDGEYVAALARTRANLSQTIAEAKEKELEMNKIRLLVEQNVISRTELEVAIARHSAASARIQDARSAVANASIHLHDTKIYAPFDGIVDRTPYKAGSLIDEGTELTVISDSHEVFTYFNVSENEYLEYFKNKESSGKDKVDVELLLADGSVHLYEGKIETIDGQFNENTGSIAFRARFSNPEKLLKHGSTGTVRLTSVMENAIVIPQKASFEIQDKHFVFVVNKNNEVKMRAFKPLYRYSHYYVVESGLKDQEKIVYEGIQNIKDGMVIIPRHFPTDSLIALSLVTR